ncbi:MAG: oligoendopeptidase, partial [Cyanobacteria bacterium RYN_339]|nr:oligoendopeptidase [Cyanobacteria bacterium RYN_339]
MSTQTTDATLRWDLAKLYAGSDDPRIDADLVQALKDAKALREQYYGKVPGLTPAALRTAFETFEKHSNSLGKLGAFASLAFSADSTDEAAKALYSRIRGDLTEIHNEMQFFDLELQQAPEETFDAWHSAPELV